MNLPGRKFWISVLLAFGGMLSQQAQGQTISNDSPFLPKSGSTTTVTENSPIELRGIMAIPGGALFGLFDPVKKLGGWVKLKEAGREFTVLSHDAASDAVTVEYQGRVLSLALKASKIESMAALPMLAQRPMTGPQGAAVSAPSIDESKRLEAVAAEVARRRQQRQAAMQQAPQVPQMPALPPQPVPAPPRR